MITMLKKIFCVVKEEKREIVKPVEIQLLTDKGFKIDYDKWKAQVDILLAAREEKRAKTEKKSWSELGYYYDEKLTKLYSIRAHSRGRVHRKFARLNWCEWRKLPISKNAKNNAGPTRYDEFVNSNGAIKFELTLEDQAAYIGDAWKEFEKKCN